MPRRTKKSNDPLEERAQEIIRQAEKAGVQLNYFFLTTFERYRTQISILAELKKKIEDSPSLVTKEYVKGRENVYSNPAIKEYNRTTDSANKTVTTLLRIINDFKQDSEEGKDPLADIINGGSDNDDSDDN